MLAELEMVLDDNLLLLRSGNDDLPTKGFLKCKKRKEYLRDQDIESNLF